MQKFSRKVRIGTRYSTIKAAHCCGKLRWYHDCNRPLRFCAEDFLFSEILQHDLLLKGEIGMPPLKKRIPGYVLAVLFSFIYGLYRGLPIAACIGIMFCIAAFLCIASALEIRSRKKTVEKENDLSFGEYQNSDAWREKYEQFIARKGFTSIRSSTMAGDLRRRYITNSIWILSGFSALVVLIGILFPAEPAVKIIFILTGTGIFAYVLSRLRFPQIREFLQSCGTELPEIEKDYLAGKLLTFRRDGDCPQNNGICIGERYTVLYEKKKISFFRNTEILKADRVLRQTKCYGDSVYLGIKETHHLLITAENARYSVELNKFQLALAYETIHRIKYMPDSHYKLEVKENIEKG